MGKPQKMAAGWALKLSNRFESLASIAEDEETMDKKSSSSSPCNHSSVTGFY